MTNWTPVLNQKLNCKKENREEALSYDDPSVGVFKSDGTLIGQTSIELPRLIDYFMKELGRNFKNKDEIYLFWIEFCGI